MFLPHQFKKHTVTLITFSFLFLILRISQQTSPSIRPFTLIQDSNQYILCFIEYYVGCCTECKKVHGIINVTFLYLNVVLQILIGFPRNINQEELTYSLGQVIMKPNIMQNYSSGYSHICVFGYQTKRQYIPDQKVVCIPHIHPVHKLFIKAILICYCCS
jgi:hypothetical protein